MGWGRNCGYMSGWLGGKQGHGNVELLDENQVYDPAFFEGEEIATWALPFKYI